MKQKIMNKTIPIIAIMSLLVIGIVSAQGGMSRVKVLHASPDAPAVDILVNDEVAIENLSFKEIVGYTYLPAGEYNIKVVPTGMTSPVVIDADVKLGLNRDYTIAATGFLDDIMPQILEDKNKGVRSKYSKIRFVHLSPNAPEVDIRVVNGPTIFDDISYKEESDYENVRAGTYDLEVVLQNGTVYKTFTGVPFDERRTYSIYAVGDVTELDVVLEEDKPDKYWRIYGNYFMRPVAMN